MENTLYMEKCQTIDFIFFLITSIGIIYKNLYIIIMHILFIIKFTKVAILSI